MALTLSTPLKIVALAGLALVLGAAGVFALTARGGSSSSSTPPAATVEVVPVTPAQTTTPAKPKLVLDPGLPAPVSHALRSSKEVVAFVYSPASAIDRALLAEVRAGARAAKVGFVALNVQKEPIAAAVYGWSSSAADPAVLVVRRPGKVVYSVNGPTDRDSVAQAASSAR
jgi:hypothetical protein